jgi:hypothetical protein
MRTGDRVEDIVDPASIPRGMNLADPSYIPPGVSIKPFSYVDTINEFN